MTNRLPLRLLISTIGILSLVGVCQGVKYWYPAAWARQPCHCKDDVQCSTSEGACPNGCDPQWTGSACRNRVNYWFKNNGYLCHCKNSRACDITTGECDNGCDQGWFGPACQYKSLTFTTLSSAHSWLTDGDDATCNTGIDQSVTVTLDTPQPLTWVRVVTTNQVQSGQIQLSYSEGNSVFVSCQVDQTTRVCETIIDIACPTSVIVTDVRLSGFSGASVCSLYVSGGRNVALKQTASGSSKYPGGWDADYGVDGDPAEPDANIAVFESVCFNSASSTTSQDWWSVVLSSPATISNFVVYNRRDPHRATCCEFRLSGFTLDVYNQDQADIYQFTDPRDPKDLNEWTDIYTIVPSPPLDQSVKSAEISKNSESPILSFCEFQAFGETVCPTGKFGLECEKTCNCVDGENCFVHSGGCPSGCKEGYTGEDCNTQCPLGKYGDGCSQDCSVHCLGEDNNCNHVDGRCVFGCDPGYTTLQCNQPCESGKYGAGCVETCSPFCDDSQGTCNNFNGSCVCDPGYTNDKCDAPCSQGTYGLGCSRNCSEFCTGDGNLCSHVDGVCSQGCDPGYTTPTCTQQCLSKTYGQDCAFGCNDTCLNGQCDHVTGNCSGCIPGYIGDFCGDECAPQTYGAGCSTNCSSSCQDLLCDHVTGHCGACVAGKSGDMCDVSIQEQQNSGGSGGGGGGGDGTMIAAVAASVGVVVVVGVVVAFLLWRRRRRNNKEPALDEPLHKQNSAIFASDRSNLGKPEGSVQTIPRSRDAISPTGGVLESKVADEDDGDMTDEDNPGEVEYSNLPPNNTEVKVAALKSYLSQHADDTFLQDQFATIPMTNDYPRTQALSVKNSVKNRYKNIIPYNGNRVTLSVDSKKNHEDYYNASYVKGAKNEREFIASQAPNDKTLTDFVRMLWEKEVGRVVMLTNLIELGKRKCTQYWPDDGYKTVGEVTMTMLTTQKYAEYTIRKFKLEKSGEAARQLTQFHFTAWPDKSVPHNPWGLVDFQQRVTDSQETGPLLVHCSAGVGRTGTFIALCNLLAEAETSGTMDFLGTLWRLRQDRMSMIQNKDQYVFLHRAALVGHMTAGTTMKVKDIDPHLKALELNDGYDKEFQAISDICSDDETKEERPVDDNVYQNNAVALNTRKNRLDNILPKKAYQAILADDDGKGNTYINAVYVPNLHQDRHDLLTQLPLPGTVADFWSLVTQCNVGLVVAYNTDLTSTDQTIAEFLPFDGSSEWNNEQFEVSTLARGDNQLWKELAFTFKRKTNSDTAHRLTCLLCKDTTLDPRKVLDLMTKVKGCRPHEKSSTLFMCRTGAEHSGLACVSSILLDRLDTDQCVAVPIVVGAMKAVRPQVIASVDQYKCLYSVLQLAISEDNVYGNMGNIKQQPVSEPDNVYTNVGNAQHAMF